MGSTTPGREALALLGTGTYDVIVLDYLEEGVDGIGLLKAVRASYGDIPFIIFTGKDREYLFSETIGNGADDIIEKAGEPAFEFAELSLLILLTLHKMWIVKERDPVVPLNPGIRYLLRILIVKGCLRGLPATGGKHP